MVFYNICKTIQMCNRLMWTGAPVTLKMRRRPRIQLPENQSVGYLWFFKHLELFPDFAGDIVCNWERIASFLSVSFTPLCGRQIKLMGDGCTNKCLLFSRGMVCIRYCLGVVNPSLRQQDALYNLLKLLWSLWSRLCWLRATRRVSCRSLADGSPNRDSM